MPKVELNRVQSQALSGARVTTTAPIGAFGGPSDEVVSATKNLFSVGAEIAQKEKDKADDVATQEAYAKTVEVKNNLFWNPETGAMNKKGKDAFGVSEEYGGAFDKQADEIEEGLANASQKAMYRRIRQNQKLELDGQLERHTFQESQQYTTEVLKSSIAVSQDDAVLNYQTPGAVEKNVIAQKALLLDYAEKEGWSPERTQLELNNVGSKTQTAVIGRMLSNGQDLEAEAYYKANKDSLHGEDVTTVEKAVEEGSRRGFAQRTATEIMAKHGNSMRAALDAARQIEDPKKQEETVREVKLRLSEREQITRDVEEKTFKQASNILEQTKQRPDPMLWNNLTLSQRNAIDNRREQLLAGVNPPDNTPEYYDQMQIASTPETAREFLNTNLLEYQDRISKGQLSKLIDMQASMKKGLKSDDLDGFRGRTQIVSQALTSIGIDPSPSEKNKANALKVYEFNNQLDLKIQDHMKTTGKKPANSEIKQFVDDMIIEGTVEGSGYFGFFQNKKPAFLATENETLKFDKGALKKIDANTRAEIEAWLRSKRKPVSDNTVLETWRRLQSQGKKPNAS